MKRYEDMVRDGDWEEIQELGRRLAGCRMMSQETYEQDYACARVNFRDLSDES